MSPKERIALIEKLVANDCILKLGELIYMNEDQLIRIYKSKFIPIRKNLKETNSVK